MAGVLVREERRRAEVQTHREKGHMKTELGTSSRQGASGMPAAPRSQERQQGSSPRAFREHTTLLTPSRTSSLQIVGEEMSAVLNHPLCGHLFWSHRKPIQVAKMHATSKPGTLFPSPSTDTEMEGVLICQGTHEGKSWTKEKVQNCDSTEVILNK